MKRNACSPRLSRALCVRAAARRSAVRRSRPNAPADASPDPKQLDTVVVQADIAYRNRTDAIAPVLSYDLEYFQRFEPLTVGDMLKRVPAWPSCPTCSNTTARSCAASIRATRRS